MLGRALPLAFAFALTGVWPASAQMGPPGGPGGGGQAPPCFNDFMPLRQEAERRAGLVKTASERKAPAKEACQLLGQFSDAEAKVVKFVETNGSWCGIPPQVVTQMKANHERTMQMHKQVCAVAAAPPRPTGPSLSDALRAGTLTTPDTVNKGKGSGTYDTLTGNALAQ